MNRLSREAIVKFWQQNRLIQTCANSKCSLWPWQKVRLNKDYILIITHSLKKKTVQNTCVCVYTSNWKSKDATYCTCKLISCRHNLLLWQSVHNNTYLVDCTSFSNKFLSHSSSGLFIGTWTHTYKENRFSEKNFFTFIRPGINIFHLLIYDFLDNTESLK